MANYVSKNTSADEGNERKRINHDLICKDFKVKIKYENLIFAVFALTFFISTATSAFLVWIFEPFKDFRNDILIYFLLLAPVVVLIVLISINFIKQRKIFNKDYTIIPDSVTRVEEDIKLYRDLSLQNIRYAMYLSRFGKLKLDKETDMNTNQVGDTVYVVVLKKQPNKALLWYNSKYFDPEI